MTNKREEGKVYLLRSFRKKREKGFHSIPTIRKD